MKATRLLFIPLALALGAGCATTKPVDQQAEAEKLSSAKELGASGARYEAQGKWASAREEFKAAMETLGQFQHPGVLMITLEYEYGRCSGVTGHFQEAEEWLKKARDGDEALNSPTYMDLTELARLNLDQNKYPAALLYFEQLFQELDRIGARDSTPAGYSDLLREYAQALDGAGKSAEADMKRQDLEDLKASHPFQRTRTDRTPYGRYPDA